jgi:hypothetical protein
MTKVYQLATALHNSAGNFFQNVFSYQLTEAGSGVSAFEYADGLISAWLTAVESKYLDLFGNDVSLDFITAKRISAPGGPSASAIVGDFGSSSQLSSSSGASADVSWQTAASTNRPGHTYLGAFPFDSLKGDVFQAAYLGKVNTWITEMLVGLTLAGALGTATFGIYSRKLTTFAQANQGLLKPKATMMNRRLVPQI